MRFMLAVVALALCAAPAFAQSTQTRWPGGARSAIALTYDDAAPSQLQYAVPQLDAANLKGTFYLMGRSMNPAVVDRWRAVTASGHELGNHTINHPCARGTFDMPVQYNSENYSVETMLTEIGAMNTLLTALDGKPGHSFASPCNQNIVGGADYIAPLAASGLATYIRDPRAPAPPAGAPAITGIGFAEVTGAQMIQWAETVRSGRGAGIAVFHGVGGDHLSVSAEAHQELVAYLAAHPRDYWVTTYSELMARMMTPGLPAR